QTELRPRIFSAVAALAPAGLQGISRGNLSSRLINDVEEIQNLGVRVVAPVVQSLVVSVASVVALALLAPTTAAWRILLETLVVSAVLALPASTYFNRIQVNKATDAREQLHAKSLEYLENQDLLQAYGWETPKLAALAELDRDLAKAQSRFAMTAGFGSAVFSLFSTLAVCYLALEGATGVGYRTLDHRMLAVLALLPMAVFEIFTQLQPALFALQKYSPSARRVSNLLAQTVPAEVQNFTGELALERVESLSLTNATFAYPNDTRTVGPVSLSLKTGEAIALTGQSGAGKSTVAFGIAGFLRPQSGRVELNGREIAEYSEAALRTRIGYLEQSPTIFNATLKANLQIGKPTATDAELWDALDQVGLRQTFESREGLDTLLGERGAAVSGGEAQRIALARALLADFQVLIFDEPTSNVDAERADQLWQDFIAISRGSTNRICVFIAHDRDFAAMGIPTLAI
ncbi:MAG: thiol reductant ABC exporter subunit CydC, partial [Actinomycetales bacterium]|nr:thiol reductant ABC exporter subunit CydC [Actinomycetales bacterium]